MRGLTTCCLLFFCLVAMRAQEGVEFYVEAPDSVAPNQVFALRFVLKNAKGADFEAPDLSGFLIASGPNMASSYQFSNGVSKQEMSYTYHLYAKEEGKYFVGPASISVEGKQLFTEGHAIIAKEGHITPEIQQRRDPFDTFWERRFDLPPAIPHQERPEETPKRRKKRNYYKRKKTYRV